ncbi:MAG: methyltransferase domain-containing protein [Pseudomonadota bacterium]
MSQEAVRSNYNDIGAFVMERIYAPGFLSLEGPVATQRLIDAAQLQANERVLEVGSGLGGPALHIAATVPCHVTGVDIVPDNVSHASDAAHAAGLAARSRFVVGDALSLPFADQRFDVVVGQDAWCHIPHKDRFVASLPGMLAPGGRVAFSDWLVADGLPADLRSEVGEVTASPGIASQAQYAQWLANAGLILEHTQDLTTVFADEYERVLARLSELEAEVTARFSAKVARIVYGKHAFIAERFQRAQLRGVLFLARVA